MDCVLRLSVDGKTSRQARIQLKNLNVPCDAAGDHVLLDKAHLLYCSSAAVTFSRCSFTSSRLSSCALHSLVYDHLQSEVPAVQCQRLKKQIQFFQQAGCNAAHAPLGSSMWLHTTCSISFFFSSRILLSSAARLFARSRLASLSCRNLLKRSCDSCSSTSRRFRLSSRCLNASFYAPGEACSACQMVPCGHAPAHAW